MLSQTNKVSYEIILDYNTYLDFSNYTRLNHSVTRFFWGRAFDFHNDFILLLYFIHFQNSTSRRQFATTAIITKTIYFGQSLMYRNPLKAVLSLCTPLPDNATFHPMPDLMPDFQFTCKCHRGIPLDTSAHDKFILV